MVFLVGTAVFALASAAVCAASVPRCYERPLAMRGEESVVCSSSGRLLGGLRVWGPRLVGCYQAMSRMTRLPEVTRDYPRSPETRR